MPDEAGDRRGRIEAKLRERLCATHVEVIDESHLHAGHAGAASGGGHFRARIVAARFEGLSPLAAQRLVYEILSEEMQRDIHALSMQTFTPAQWEARTRSGQDA
ncbi:MAG: BolA family transcriptional regulator [Deltaproteobacteria bacterium]|nr:MAG: BolA family transcriptional regulator [Deltaproteobacteria bacterium]